MRLTDTSEDSKLVHSRKRPKVDTLFSSLFFRRVRATSMTQRRVENTSVYFWMFSPVSVKLIIYCWSIYVKILTINILPGNEVGFLLWHTENIQGHEFYKLDKNLARNKVLFYFLLTSWCVVQDVLLSEIRTSSTVLVAEFSLSVKND